MSDVDVVDDCHAVDVSINYVHELVCCFLCFLVLCCLGVDGVCLWCWCDNDVDSVDTANVVDTVDVVDVINVVNYYWIDTYY